MFAQSLEQRIDDLAARGWKRKLKYGIVATAALGSFALENYGKLRLVREGIDRGNLLAPFAELIFGKLDNPAVARGLAEIAIGYAILIPIELYLGADFLGWMRQRLRALLGPDHPLTLPLGMGYLRACADWYLRSRR